ncbi:hypothetical protein [Salinimicrobium oceani]|uniref:Uncharacterized protein n=1 Tax=Salinimicrobium oceani TaxID=2722702 RepID=A0ABX1CZN5_9FLAO|nr:hypothetical protein [Salinimicrobium oceani]NJW53257.1 hypothetical protein [Salinimicrobium oceani]
MKFNNRKETSVIPSIYIIVVAVFITNAFASVELKYDDVPFNYSSLIPNVIALLVGIYIFVVGKTFEFDSDGETINFKSNGVLVSQFMHYREQRTEVPKSKLKDFRVENYFFYKRLHIYIHSRNSKGYRHYRYNITFLTAKKVKSLKMSLAKVLEKNKARV